jgi:H+/gluconate symporter-like permease
MHIRKLSAAAAAISVLGVAAPVGAASAATLTFVPPRVGPLSVSIGPTIIGGKVISAGVNVTTPGVSLAPLVWTPPAGWNLPISWALPH